MPEDSYDAVVVGAGLGGLTAAAYLAASGRRTLVLEHNMVAGGCSQVFRRKGKWEFDVGVHYVGQCQPGGQVHAALRGLGLDRRITWRPLDPDGYATLHFPGLTFRVPRGWDNYLDRLVETFPADRHGLIRCVGKLRRMAAGVAKGVPAERHEFLLAPLRMPATVVGSTMTLQRLFDRCRLSPEAQAVIVGECGDYACPPSKTSAAFHAGFLNHYLEAGGFYPEGGGQVLAAHLIDVIATHGGAVHTKVDVERILIEGGRANGVLLSDGRIVRAPVVVSNADIRRTYGELVGREHLTPRTAARVEQMRMALPLFSVYLGLDVPLHDRMANTTVWSYPTYDIESLYTDFYAGRMPAQLPIFMTSASVKDPSNRFAAPTGYSTLEVMAIVPPGASFWGQDQPMEAKRTAHYLATKEKITQAIVDEAARLLPGLREHIVFCEASTPVTQERFTLSTDGACYGLELAIDQTAHRRPTPRAEVPGLYLTGASTVYNHGIVGAITGGLGTASAVLGRKLSKEVAAGRVLVDAARLGPVDSGWDPWLHSKPRAPKSG